MTNWRKILSWLLAYDREVIDSLGNKYYYNENNQLHNLSGPAVEYPDVYRAYCVDGKLHRTDGPAIEHANGSKYYYVDGKKHKTDGLAVVLADGTKYYYVNNIELSEEEFNEKYRRARLKIGNLCIGD